MSSDRDFRLWFWLREAALGALIGAAGWKNWWAASACLAFYVLCILKQRTIHRRPA